MKFPVAALICTLASFPACHARIKGVPQTGADQKKRALKEMGSEKVSDKGPAKTNLMDSPMRVDTSLTLIDTDVSASIVLSDFPSSTPSDMPSMMPSDAPSTVPSDTPSSVPSDTPSSVALSPTISRGRQAIPVLTEASDVVTLSDFPSMTPSDFPSMTPGTFDESSLSSDAPSDAPSMTPSDTPSLIPTEIPTATPPADDFTATEQVCGAASSLFAAKNLMNVRVTFLYKLAMTPDADAELTKAQVETDMYNYVRDEICNDGAVMSTTFSISADPQDMQTGTCGDNCVVMLGRITLMLDSTSFVESKIIYCKAREAVQDFFTVNENSSMQGMQYFELLNRSPGTLCDAAN